MSTADRLPPAQETEPDLSSSKAQTTTPLASFPPKVTRQPAQAAAGHNPDPDNREQERHEDRYQYDEWEHRWEGADDRD